MKLSEDDLKDLAVACQEECVRIHIEMIQLIQESKPEDFTWHVNWRKPWWEPSHMYEKRCQEANAARRSKDAQDK